MPLQRGTPLSPDAHGATSAQTANGTIHVFIAEDHRITLWGLQRLVDTARQRMRVVGSATSLPELLTAPALADTDILLLDLDLGGADSIEAITGLQQRLRGHILVLTGADDPERHRAAVLRGARGVVHKSQGADLLLRAIEKVHAGEVWLERGLLGAVLSQLTNPGGSTPRPDENLQRIARLTTREREIVACVVRHSGDKQLVIAHALGLSENTLRNHLSTIYSKLGVRGRLELHLFATQHQIGPQPHGAL